MKNKILILCEGVTDQAFIADCINLFYGINVDRSEPKRKERSELRKSEIKFENGGLIIEIGGCDNLNKQVEIDRMNDNTMIGGVNIIIFDADSYNNGNNGFENAQRSLNALQKKSSFDYYLWPNHQDDGEIEDLLRKLIHQDRESVMNCIEKHQECLKQTGIEGLHKADNKDIIRYYLFTNSVKDTKGISVDYKNANLWDLNTNLIYDLKKFKLFLDKYFI